MKGLPGKFSSFDLKTLKLSVIYLYRKNNIPGCVRDMTDLRWHKLSIVNNSCKCTLSCKCRKRGLNCNEMCRCHDCENDEKDEFVKAADQMIHEKNDY